MKSFPRLSRALLHTSVRGRFVRACGIGALVVTTGWMVSVQGSLPSWVRNIEAGTAIEAAFFRAMSLPGGDVLFRRPPSETRPALGALITAQPKDADLYSLRALEDEQQLDFNAAEADWKKYVESADAKLGAQITLADFYHRRVRPLDEIKALSVVANAPADVSEALVDPTEQQSWHAFERIFAIIQDQGLGKEFSVTQYRAWLVRYPHEESLYARFLQFLVAQKNYAAATKLSESPARSASPSSMNQSCSSPSRWWLNEVPSWASRSLISARRFLAASSRPAPARWKLV